MENSTLTYKPTGIQNISLPCRYVVIAPIRKSPYEETIYKIVDQRYKMVDFVQQQARTLEKKKKFLEFYANEGRGMIAPTCKMVGIKSSKTVYNWIKNDPGFKDAMDEMVSIINDYVEDVLMHLIFIKKDGPSIRYFLNRRHPDYMLKRTSRPPQKKVYQWK